MIALGLLDERSRNLVGLLVHVRDGQEQDTGLGSTEQEHWETSW
jgi:hypothetical protein